MSMEKSCGAVVFTRLHGEIRYLLVQNPHGIYGFPKGHMEGTETERETALREIREETSLEVEFLPGFRTEDFYTLPGKQAKRHIVYFLAQFRNQEYRFPPKEISGGGLYSYEQARKMFQFESSRRILQEAEEYLQDK